MKEVNKMGIYRIMCILHDNDKVITHVGTGNEIHTVEKVWNWINDGIHTYYTEEDGNRANVYHRVHPKTGRRFLTTEPDGVDENNLDFLSYCQR
jgi:hypothetical protein